MLLSEQIGFRIRSWMRGLEIKDLRGRVVGLLKWGFLRGCGRSGGGDLVWGDSRERRFMRKLFSIWDSSIVGVG